MIRKKPAPQLDSGVDTGFSEKIMLNQGAEVLADGVVELTRQP
jgi:hypothetical protein